MGLRSGAARAVLERATTGASCSRTGTARPTTRLARARPSDKRKYFEHAGARMTADASGDELLKFEGVSKGTELNFYR